MIWFTSDWHFFHDRILEFHPKRKELFGENMKEVTEKMIRKWNDRIDKRDTVYILGDLAFGSTDERRKLFQRLNGNKVLILGNHDKVSDDHKCFFNHITQIKNIKLKKSVYPVLEKDIELVMCHFPMFSWEHIEKGSVMLHGHCHGDIDQYNTELLKTGVLRLDVGIDSSFANYDFVSIDKLASKISKDIYRNEKKEVGNYESTKRNSKRV